MELTPAKRRALRAEAHHLDPVVSIGNQGLTPAVLHEIDVNLLAHELVKLKVHSDDREAREQLVARVCDALDAAPVQHVGKVLILYRERKEQEESAPRAKRTSAKHAPEKRPGGKRQSRPATNEVAKPRAFSREARRGAAPASASTSNARKTTRARRRLG